MVHSMVWSDTMDLGWFIVWFIVHLNFTNLEALQSLRVACILSNSAHFDEMVCSAVLHLDIHC